MPGRVRGLIDEVSVASGQQAQGIDQVSQAIAQMEKVTQTTAATAEESAASSAELSGQADVALQAVARLATLAGGAATASATRRPASRTTPRAVALDRRRQPEVPPVATGTYGRF